MAWYIRTLNTTNPVSYASLDDAIAQVVRTVEMHMKAGKRSSRTTDGKIGLHEPDASLFNVIWIEGEDGRVMRF
jgi:hypothetical protein